jgi:SAM-dependent methyltransferase
MPPKSSAGKSPDISLYDRFSMSGYESTAYDKVTYPGSPFSQTHPDRLATMAALYGLAAPPPERCRVLELGCGDGGNLIPMAYVLPESTFLGLDAAGSAVAQGRERIAALGMTNVTLVHADLLDAADLGTFDYVIAHGVYSWVPPSVQERVLAIASEVLAPNGVAYVSYNALPGCHVRNAMRQMMRWHVRDMEEPTEKIEQARGFVRLLGEAAPPRPLFSAILKETLDQQAKQSDAILFHDDLAEINEPLLFIDFLERASRHRLKFLSEADYCDMAVWNADSPAGRFLLGVGAENTVLHQQYRDFLIFRRFRQTLLCREDASLAKEPDPEVLRSLYVGASTRPESKDPDVASDEPVSFKSEKDGNVTTPHPLSKAAFLELGVIWPRWVRISDLLATARARVSAAGGRPVTVEDEARLLRFLLGSYGPNVAQLRSTACPFVTEISERPRASALARLQARTLTAVTNLRHASVRLEDPLVRTFLELLDGTRDRMTIASAMAAALRKTDPAAVAADVENGIALNFARVSRLALLEG